MIRGALLLYDGLGGLLPSIIHIVTDVLYCDHGLSNVHVHRNVMQCTPENARKVLKFWEMSKVLRHESSFFSPWFEVSLFFKIFSCSCRSKTFLESNSSECCVLTRVLRTAWPKAVKAGSPLPNRCSKTLVILETWKKCNNQSYKKNEETSDSVDAC